MDASPSNISVQMSNAEARSWPEAVQEVIECDHGEATRFYTSWTWMNPGRRFFRCPFWQHDDCEYFKWYDDEISRYYKDLVFYSVKEKKILQNEVHLLKEKEKILHHKLKLSNEGVKHLKEENEKLNKKIERLTESRIEISMHKKQLRAEKRKLKFVNLMLIFAMLMIAVGLYQYFNGKNAGRISAMRQLTGPQPAM